MVSVRGTAGPTIKFSVPANPADPSSMGPAYVLETFTVTTAVGAKSIADCRFEKADNNSDVDCEMGGKARSVWQNDPAHVHAGTPSGHVATASTVGAHPETPTTAIPDCTVAPH